MRKVSYYSAAKTAALVIGLIALSVPAQASAINLFTGQDDGASISGPFTNSVSARNDFLTAATAYGAINTHGFKHETLGYSATNAWGDGSGTFDITSTDTNSADGFGITNNSAACGAAAANLCGFNIGASNDRFLSLAAGSATFNMTDSTNSFGFFATGIQQEFGSTFTISFNDGASQVLNIPINVGGGAQFYGFTDTSTFTSVTISRPADSTNGSDYWGIDNVSFNVAATPIPATLPLFATGLGLIGLFARRKTRKKTGAALPA